MSDKPIIFSGPMVRTILAGRKTQTRRVLKNFPDQNGRLRWYQPYRNSRQWQGMGRDHLIHAYYDAPYAVGCRLWVRETFVGARGYDNDPPSKFGNKPLWYTADGEPDRERWWHLSDRKRSPIHMPRWASRMTLIVEDVRVQRVQEINRGDAMAEGCPFANMADGPNPRDWFSDLWDSLNAGRVGCSWSDNPWVVALTFRTIQKNIDEVKADE